MGRWATIWCWLCVAFLAVEPTVWLVRTWIDPSWDSIGGFVFVGVVALLVSSVASGLEAGEQGGRRVRRGVAILAVTAVIRVAGYLLAVNVISALALVLDVYAIALILGVDRRRRSLSPFWVAVLFAFTMPFERIAQRVIGFGLQQVSAQGACGALSTMFDNVVCNGVEITLAGVHVLVDLPCSGARGLVLLAATFALFAARSRPGAVAAGVGIVLVTVSALISNTWRITMLAVGIARWSAIDVMAQPWHDIIGLVALGLGILPVAMWSRCVTPRAAPASQVAPATRNMQHATAVVLTIACVAVQVSPRTPVDVARTIEAIELPYALGATVGRDVALTEREQQYFTAFGGAAAKRSYGDNTLMVVRTSAPLRHLHGPDECLRGAGFDVQRVGISHGVLSGATYRAVAPDGRVWRVTATYISSGGDTATSVSEVVWRWLADPSHTWTAVERVTPWDAPASARESFDRSIIHTLSH